MTSVTSSVQDIMQCANQLEQASASQAKFLSVKQLGRKFMKISKEYFLKTPSHSVDKGLMAAMEKAMHIVEKERERIELSQEEREEVERYTQTFHVLAYPEEKIGKLIQAGNQKLLRKWVDECKFPEEAFFANPDLVKVIFSTHIHQAIRYYEHTIRFDSETKEMQIMVNGEFQNARPILVNLRFENELIVDDSVAGKTWIYLEKGLCERHETNWEKLEPFAKLSQEELAYVQEKAKRHPTPQAKLQSEGAPCYVLEVVSSWKKIPCSDLTSGIMETLEMPRHPWIRLINPEGDVRSVGFYPATPVELSKGAKTIEGVFRSPDPWETTPFQARFVTRFAITADQFSQTVEMIEQFQSKDMAFNLFEHNCTRFVQHVLETVELPTPKGISFGEVISRLIPIPVQRMWRGVEKTVESIVEPIKQAVKLVINECLPPAILKAAKFVIKKFELLQNLFIYWLGGAQGILLEHFPDLTDELERKRAALISGLSDFFNENLVRPLMPRQIIEWQMTNPATTVYDREFGFRGQLGRKKEMIQE